MDINVVCLLEKIPDRVPSLPGISLIPVINIFLSLEERIFDDSVVYLLEFGGNSKSP